MNYTKALIFILFISSCMALGFGCKVIKGKTTESIDLSKLIKSDSGKVEIKDSGSVKTNSGTNAIDNKWWKETIIYPPKDSTVNNYYSYTTPAIIYREGGQQKQESTYNNRDSAWAKSMEAKYQASVDSITVALNRSKKSKETQVFTIWQIVGISFGASLITFLLSKFKISKS